jgi:2-oxoglutarate/2-oxoacid ferredoxin oxidoreductase subunit alpha
MRLNILIGGEAGKGINTISEIFSEIMIEYGYYVFNYKDYPSLIRGGHNFNIINISDKPISSYESKIDIILAIDDKTINIHKAYFNKKIIIINSKNFEKFGINLNLALLGRLLGILGVDKLSFLKKIKEKFNNKNCIIASEEGFNSSENKFNLKKINNNLSLMSGSKGVAEGAFASGVNCYIAYPMTPATPVMNELASMQNDKNDLMVFQFENEIAVINSALGASFSGLNVMVGTSGGGFDLMSEGLSLQGMSEIPLTVYLASRSGPATGVPTYNSQADLNIALRAGHGEFPRLVVAPGDSIESFELTSQALYLSSKLNLLSIILSDKHVAESQFSFSNSINKKGLKIIQNRKIPSKNLVKVSSYEHDKFGNTVEDVNSTLKGYNRRLKKYSELKNYCKRFDMFKIYGNKKSKNIILGWGSTKGVILDSIKNLDCKFLQVLYLKPISDNLKKELEKANNIILIEYNSTGQLGRIIREKTGIKIPEKNRILKYDSRPFASDELIKEIKKRLK